MSSEAEDPLDLKMKKIVLMVMLMISSMFGNELVLSGEYAKDLGNPFRVLLEKKDKNISITVRQAIR